MSDRRGGPAKDIRGDPFELSRMTFELAAVIRLLSWKKYRLPDGNRNQGE
jgi:hypothetical protein